MKKAHVFIVVFAVLLIPSLVFAESVTLTTYYPAPYGSYDRMKLVPRTSAPDCNPGDDGIFYYDSGLDDFRVCRDIDGDGTPGWEKIQGMWSRVGNTVYLNESDFGNDLKIGLGDNAPDAILEISDSNVFGSTGTIRGLIQVSGDDNSDGEIFTIQNSGKVGLGTNDPSAVEGAVAGVNGARLVVQADGNAGGTSPILVTDSSGNPVMIVRDDASLGLGVAANQMDPDNMFEIGGDFEIEANGSELTFFETATDTLFSVGIDPADQEFKISASDTIIGSDLFKMDSAGNVTIGGSLTVQDEDGNEGDVKVIWVDEASNPGYYATYAP